MQRKTLLKLAAPHNNSKYTAVRIGCSCHDGRCESMGQKGKLNQGEKNNKNAAVPPKNHYSNRSNRQYASNHQTASIGGLINCNLASDGRRAFIRRTRSNDTSKRMAIRSRSTEFENLRAATGRIGFFSIGATTPTAGAKNSGVSATPSVMTVATMKNTPSHISYGMGVSDGDTEDGHPHHPVKQN